MSLLKPNNVLVKTAKEQWDKLSDKNRSIITKILLGGALLTGGGMVVKHCTDSHITEREETIKKYPSIDQSDITILQQIFPNQKQKTDISPIITELEKKGVITKIATEDDIPESFINLEDEQSDKFVFSDVSFPQVHPDFAEILVDISEKFNDRLKELGYTGGYVKITLTSVTRPTDTNKSISNASDDSAHQYGISADMRIVGDRFQTTDNARNNDKQEDTFMFVLAEILDEMQANGSIIVMTEKAPSHFHINMADGKPQQPSLVLQQIREQGKNSLDIEGNEKYDPAFYVTGRNYGDLYAAYLGKFTKNDAGKINFGSTRIEKDMKVVKDADQIMNLLRRKKFQRANTEGFTVARDFYNNVVEKIDFNAGEKSDIKEYKNDIKNSIEQVKNSFDYNQFNTDTKKRNYSTKLHKNLWDDNKQTLFKKMVDNIDENVILSYNLTEFFPQGAPGGKTEYRMIDFILQHYGKDFVFYVPAVGDNYASFGSYQFTSLAIYDTPTEKRGASVMNYYLTNEDDKIPGSVTKLSADDHHRAAVLFAMYNLRSLILKLSDRDVMSLLDHIDNDTFKATLAQIIAIGHNYPANLNYVAEHLSSDVSNGKKLYQQMKGKHTYDYATKTYFNYRALVNGVEYKDEPNLIYVDSPDIVSTKKSQNDQHRNFDKPITAQKNPLEYIRENSKHEKIYTYTLQSGGNVRGVKKATAHRLKISKDDVIVVDEQGNPYQSTHKFTKGSKVYVKIKR